MIRRIFPRNPFAFKGEKKQKNHNYHNLFDRLFLGKDRLFSGEGHYTSSVILVAGKQLQRSPPSHGPTVGRFQFHPQ